ncbi:MAG: glycosyl hydrolase 108 family protein [Candidatus Paceibacterota bacterium]|jgi:lysozyme family protein
MNLFDRAFKFTEENEGGFVNDKRDKGGATYAGISSRWFSKDYEKIINTKDKNEQHNLIKSFYLREFWNPLYDELKNDKLAIRLFDLGVNLGKRQSVMLLQNTLLIAPDGKFGRGTLSVANATPDVYDKFIDRAETYYKSLPDFTRFGKGWLNRLHKLIKDLS